MKLIFVLFVSAFVLTIASAKSHKKDESSLKEDQLQQTSKETKPTQRRKDPYHPDVKPTRYDRRQDTGVDWMARGQQELNVALNSWPKWQRARNVIYFIGDGMGVSTLTAGRIFKAQREGQSVTEAKLSWEQFPYTGLVKTYNTDQQVPDSAGTATAFICGEKARDGVICVNENVRAGNCSSMAGNELRSMVHYAQDEGKWAGIISTARITHATPACAYAHSPDRDWEADSDVPLGDRETCWDIARQLVHGDDNKELRVVLGGGRKAFIPREMDDNEPPYSRGDRRDGRDLRQDWLGIKAGMGLAESQYSYVENKTDFNNIDPDTTEYLMGLFEWNHMKYEVDRLQEEGDVWTEPSMAEMVKKSLDILKRGPEGYVLYVEGGRVDHAHHVSRAQTALMDVVSLQDAVDVAMTETDAEDTLIILTADHSHTFSMGGYQKLENDILGLVTDDDDTLELADDDKPYLTLSYANGIGFLTHRSENGLTVDSEIPRINLTGIDYRALDFEYDGPVPMFSETHAGEDVAVYARGPMAHLFSGQHEQHYIAHAAMYASCVGWNKDFCQSNPPPPCAGNKRKDKTRS